MSRHELTSVCTPAERMERHAFRHMQAHVHRNMYTCLNIESFAATVEYMHVQRHVNRLVQRHEHTSANLCNLYSDRTCIDLCVDTCIDMCMPAQTSGTHSVTVRDLQTLASSCHTLCTYMV